MTPTQARLIIYGGLFVIGAVTLGIGNLLDERRIRRMRKQTEKALADAAETYLYCYNITNPDRFEGSFDFLDELEKKIKE